MWRDKIAMLTLVVGNKNTSSWSLRPWIVLKHHSIHFEEQNVTLRQPDTRARCLEHSPSGKVPVLKDDDLVIWDTMAIFEYLAESFPNLALWPGDRATRAYARSISAEMHAGFPDLRNDMPVDILARHETPEMTEGLARDIARVHEIWETCLAAPKGGPFLFGGFTIADAMFAPVVTRFVTYQAPLSPTVAAYTRHIMELAAMREWIEGARYEEATREK